MADRSQRQRPGNHGRDPVVITSVRFMIFIFTQYVDQNLKGISLPQRRTVDCEEPCAQSTALFALLFALKNAVVPAGITTR